MAKKYTTENLNLSFKKKRILLDPGHGWNPIKKRFGRPLMHLEGNKVNIVPNSMFGHEKEEEKSYYREDFGTLEIAKKTKELLELMNFEVFMTREDKFHAPVYLKKVLNTNKKLYKSWQWIQEARRVWECDYLVSLHTNAGRGTGTAGFYDKEEGKHLALSICNEISSQLCLRMRSVTKHSYLILRDMPEGQSCLIECAFHDYVHDLKLLLNNKDEFAKAIAQGIINYVS